METKFIFTDGSVNPHSGIGYGAYLILPSLDFSLADLKSHIHKQRFTHTSSTKLEIQTLLYALSKVQSIYSKIVIYTDSQNIIGLQARRKKLEANQFQSNQQKPLHNALLYKEFYQLTDTLDCIFHKVRGHSPSKQKTKIEKIFSLVDKASRQALRADQAL
jgi:ribonuclease HI